VSDRFDKFTPRARRVLELASDEAERQRHAEVGPEHVLLGLLREGRGLGTLALRELDVTPDEVRRRIEQHVSPGDYPTPPPIPLSPAGRHVVAMAEDESNRFHHNYLGTEHLLLGLLREGEGVAFLTLDGLGVTLDRARRQVITMINASPRDAERAGRPGVVGMVRGMRSAREESIQGAEQCLRCERAGRPEWKFCPFCGEPRPRCERCGEPVPRLSAIMYCPHCGGVVGDDEPA
jgi:ATP-dependent Clp protease ATP-binding subunit ClpA